MERKIFKRKKHGHASAISSLGKLLARSEPSGEQRVRPSLVFPHFVNRATLSLHWPIGPQDPVPSTTTAISTGVNTARYAIVCPFFPLVSLRLELQHRPKSSIISTIFPFCVQISFYFIQFRDRNRKHALRESHYQSKNIFKRSSSRNGVKT